MLLRIAHGMHTGDPEASNRPQKPYLGPQSILRTMSHRLLFHPRHPRGRARFRMRRATSQRHRRPHHSKIGRQRQRRGHHCYMLLGNCYWIPSQSDCTRASGSNPTIDNQHAGSLGRLRPWQPGTPASQGPRLCRLCLKISWMRTGDMLSHTKCQGPVLL